MSFTCSRCGTEVPSGALYCPYCNLQKPKSGYSAGAHPEEARLREHTKPSIGPKGANKEQKSSSSRPIKTQRDTTVKTPRTTTSRSFRLPIAAAIVALLGVGIYIFVVPLVYSEQAEPKVVLSALETLRRMPSNEPGLTIDARLTRDLETARRVKNLVSYKGWTVQPIKGTKTKVLMVYSYLEVGDVNKRAEWIADLTTNTFIPQSDMATAVSSR